eukprot:EG_transcript_8604
MASAFMDKENSRPCLSSPKSGVAVMERSPAKGLLADLVNMTLSPTKEKGGLKGTPASPATAGRRQPTAPALSSTGTPVRCLSTYWLERYHTAREQKQDISPPPAVPALHRGAPAAAEADAPGVQAAAPLPRTGSEAAEAPPAPETSTASEPPPSPAIPPRPSEVVAEAEAPPAPAAAVSFPLSPKAKPFLPKASTPQSTPLSPKAKPFVPKGPQSTPLSPKAAPFVPHRWALFQDPASAPYDAAVSPGQKGFGAADFPSLTSPVMLPLTRPGSAMSPFTPSSLPVSLPQTMSSSNLLAPTREQAKAKELSRLESLWVRRATPVKVGERPPSPAGNVLTSPETWTAVNWWSPSNKPLRHCAVQAEGEAREAATETEAAPKQLFAEADTMTEAAAGAVDVTTEVDADLRWGSSAECGTMTPGQSEASSAAVPQGPRGHLAWRALLRLQRSAAKASARADRRLAQRVRRETLSRTSSSAGAWSAASSSAASSLGDSLRTVSIQGLTDDLEESIVVAPLLSAPVAALVDAATSPCGAPSPCLSDASLRTALSGDGAS